MTKLFILLISLLVPFNLTKELRWGQSGHRATGYIAESLLTDKAAAEVKRVLGGNSLAEVSTWMDEVRSDPNFRFMSPWHYSTIPPGSTYEEAGTPEEGDAIWAINTMINELKAGELTPQQEAINLKVLVHLIGDLHQPLHVGNGTDRGGNDVRLQWFGENSNLHRVWDSQMIDGRQLNGSELADFSLNNISEMQIAEWQKSTVLDWAYESSAFLDQVYDFEGERLSYEYSFLNFDTVQLRIAQAGVRLAGVINEIYGD